MIRVCPSQCVRDQVGAVSIVFNLGHRRRTAENFHANVGSTHVNHVLELVSRNDTKRHRRAGLAIDQSLSGRRALIRIHQSGLNHSVEWRAQNGRTIVCDMRLEHSGCLHVVKNRILAILVVFDNAVILKRLVLFVLLNLDHFALKAIFS